MHIQNERGFSLVEMIVAVGLFAVVMVICVSTLFALVNANRKAQALQSVMNNLNISLDGMARAIRMGHSYHCDDGTGITTGTRDCGDPLSGNPPGTRFIFEHYGGNTGNPNDQWIYRYDADTKRISKSTQGGAVGTFYEITAPEVTVDSMKFYVVGTCRKGDAPPCPATDVVQPKVVIVIKGTVAADNARTKSTFHIQAAATQRLIDL